ncbi:MAG: NAD(P)/FAD-dependent oxidoreductase [Phycisphaerales bacterium]
MAQQRVIIVGGGVIGVCCAEALARRGVAVRLLEGERIAGACSFGNSGFIAPGHGPLCRPGLFETAMASMVDPDAQFHIPPTTDPRTLDWLRRFRDACTTERYEFCLRVLADFGRDMLDRFGALVHDYDLDCDYRTGGSDTICYTERTRDRVAREVGAVSAMGLPARALDGASARLRQPALLEGAVGGGAFDRGASIHPYRFVAQLTDRLRERGVAIEESRPVRAPLVRSGRCVGVELDTGETIEADGVVLATGMATPALLEPFGARLPMTNATGYHADIGGVGRLLPRTVTIADADLILTPMDDFVRISGTVAIGPNARRLAERRLPVMVERALRSAPILREGAIISRWEGHRPATPDGLPVISAIPGAAGLVVATAHARLGLSLGPATGDLVASMVCEEATAFDTAAFRVDRF